MTAESSREDRPLLVVDAANVVGSVPDGWWRDRARATRALRDHLVGVALDGLGDGALEVVLVTEGKARDVESVDGVEVVAARGSGDDAIVEVVARRGSGRRCLVATADRALSARVGALGAAVIGPRRVRHS